MYFSRIQLGHALEGLKLVGEIRDDPELLQRVERCDPATQRSFARVSAFLDGPDFKTLDRIRNNLAFHYDRKLVLSALKRLVKAEPDRVSSFTLGTEVLLWHFPLADDVVDVVMVEDILKLPSKSRSEDVDLALAGLWAIQDSFADFVGYFVRRHL